MPKSARKAAFHAVLASLQKNVFASQVLEDWRKSDQPSGCDMKFAREIAYGTLRMASSLDYIAHISAEHKKISLKLREKALLRCGIYQIIYMDRTPGYAIVNECVKIAKELGNPSFPGFLNALLRKVQECPPEFPLGKDPNSLSIRHSYPSEFIETLIRDYGIEKAEFLLVQGNLPAVTQARKRKTLEMVDIDNFENLSKDDQYYIQNYTPAYLMDKLSSGIQAPKKVLDLCAAPGGKLLAIHDLFPSAELYANEISHERIPRLLENIRKYKLNVNVKEGPGESYWSNDKFDLIVLDVPCSNSGVLNKRPEARWRLNAEALRDLQETQLRLIENSAKLLNIGGAIFYMTCSILRPENEEIVAEACKKFNLKMDQQHLILPDTSLKQDGGFGCLLSNK